MGNSAVKNKPPLWKRRYLVQAAYQLRYSLLIAIIGALALIVAYYAIQYVVSTGMLPIIVPRINLFKVTGFMFFSWFFLGVIYTHTTAGPVTQLINQIDNVARGDLKGAEVRFRRGDDLQDLPEYFNNMVKILQFRSKEEKVLLKDLENHLCQVLEQVSNREKDRGELETAVRFCIRRIDKLVAKKERYLGLRNLDSVGKDIGRG